MAALQQLAQNAIAVKKVTGEIELEFLGLPLPLDSNNIIKTSADSVLRSYYIHAFPPLPGYSAITELPTNKRAKCAESALKAFNYEEGMVSDGIFSRKFMTWYDEIKTLEDHYQSGCALPAIPASFFSELAEIKKREPTFLL